MLDKTMIESLETLDVLLDSYTQEEFISEMKKYEIDEGIRIDEVNFNSSFEKISHKIHTTNLTAEFHTPNQFSIGLAA